MGGKFAAPVAPHQIKTRKEAHQVKGKKQDGIENELMNQMTRRERTETVEEMDPEQIKNSEGMVKRAVQDCGADKQEMVQKEMMNLMRNIQEGTSENQEEVKRNSDKPKGTAQYTITRCETASLLKLAGQLCRVWGLISPSSCRCAHNVWCS